MFCTDLTLGREALAAYRILIPENAGKCPEFAAGELQKYLYATCGAELSVVRGAAEGPAISLGLTAAIAEDEYRAYAAKTHDDGFAILASGGNVYIVSATDRGILYGVYEFLERYLGVRFYMPDCEKVPSVESFTVDAERITSPDFPLRTYISGTSFHEGGDMVYATKSRILDVWNSYSEELGGPPPVFGRHFCHNMHLYVPYAKYVNDHPEWYRFMVVNNELNQAVDVTNGITADGKLDESMSESVAKSIIAELIVDLEAHPDVNTFVVTHEDGPIKFESERCREEEAKYRWSGMLIRLCNVVIRAVNDYAKKNMNGRTVKLMTFAYSFAADAPVKEENGALVPLDPTVVADENLIIQMALFSNGTYDYFSPKQDERLRRSLREWPIVAKNFWFWAYDTNFFRYFAFFDSFGNIAANVRGFKKMGIRYLCMQGGEDTPVIWHNNIRAYAYHKLMWDVTLDPDALMDEYIDAYYEAGAPFVKEMIRIWHENNVRLLESGRELYSLPYGNHIAEHANPLELVLKAHRLILDGMTAIRKSDVPPDRKRALLKRMEAVRLTPLHYLYDRFYGYFPDGKEEDYKRAQKEYFRCAKRAGAVYVAEHWKMPQYLEEGAMTCPALRNRWTIQD